VLPLLLLSVLVADQPLPQRQEATLRFKYDAKSPVVYDVRRTFKAPNGDEELTYVETWTFSVHEPLTGGAAKLKVERTLLAMVVDGLTIKLDPSSNTSIEDHSPRGDVRNRVPTNQIEPVFELRLLRIGDVLYPPTAVSAGAKWEVVAKATETGIPAAKWLWSFDEFAEGKTKGTFTFAEQEVELPVQAEGKFAFSLEDGWPADLSFIAINTHKLGDEEKLPMVYTFSMKRR
jgi:hypothetical protein